MNERISKQTQCTCDSRELCPIFTMIMQGNYHNLEGRKEGRKEGEAVKEGERRGEREGWRKGGRDGRKGRQKKC